MAQNVYHVAKSLQSTGRSERSGVGGGALVRCVNSSRRPVASLGVCHAPTSEAKPPDEPVSAHDISQPVSLSTKRNLLDQLRAYGYRLGKRIGEGSYSKVYYAKHISDPRPGTPSVSGGCPPKTPTTATTSYKRTTHSAHPTGRSATRPTTTASCCIPSVGGGGGGGQSATNLGGHPSASATTTTKAIACKIIDARCTSPEYMDKFLPRELEIIKNLQHPNIVSVYTILEIGPFICCFMDFCAFGDLLDRIRYRGPLTAPETQSYFAQLASAVHYLHSANIAHRDIKCENVLIQNRYCVKLTDFGFARPLVGRGGAIEYSDTFCGSAAYAAPEVLKGIRYDPRRYDMWSLGCVLYIMATGSMPYDDENIAATIRRQEQHHIVYPAAGVVGAELRELIARLLQPDVERRLTVDQLLAEAWMNGGGGVAGRAQTGTGEMGC